MQRTVFMLVALVFFAGIAQAQIAAPLLNPVAIESAIVTPGRLLKAVNPAVLPWSGASRIGAAAADLKAEAIISGLTFDAGTGDGKVLQGRYVGENLAIGAEAYNLELVDPGNGSTSDFSSSLVSVAFQFAEMISVGGAL